MSNELRELTTIACLFGGFVLGALMMGLLMVFTGGCV